MIRSGTGNLLEADAEALVNTVNCVGVMGKGIALQFKQAFPENFKAYARAVERGEVQLGRMFIFETGALERARYIVNFPTKQDWRSKSRIEDIRSGVESLVSELRRLGIRSIAVPPLGCGNGGLSWTDVRPLIELAFASAPDIDALLFEPGRAPRAEEMPVRTKKPNLTPLRAMLLKLIERYRPADRFEPAYRLSMLEVQKLAYFLQEAGAPLRLDFVAHIYGPYAEKLNHLLQDLDGHFIRGFGDRSPGQEIWLEPGASEQAAEVLAGATQELAKLEAVSRLIEGFETPHGMELLATVHWLAKHDAAPLSGSAAAISRVHAWNPRKARIFTPKHVEVAWDRLVELEWIHASPA
jgi:O-acetyl-ADP-ribose deacetylase (regulator of RNase III)